MPPIKNHMLFTPAGRTTFAYPLISVLYPFIRLAAYFGFLSAYPLISGLYPLIRLAAYFGSLSAYPVISGL